MKKRIHGASRFFVSDKNVYEALIQRKVDIPTVLKLFKRRNVIVSTDTSRENLAKRFAMLSHDYYDHKIIAEKLGVVSRRERITSMDVHGNILANDLHTILLEYKAKVEDLGDVVRVTRDGDFLQLDLQYSEVDYARSEFSQVQVRDGKIEFIKNANGYTVRNTQSDVMSEVRDSLLSNFEDVFSSQLTKIEISLYDIPDPTLRSKFFYLLSDSAMGFTKKDVNDVYVYKPKPDESDDDSDSLGTSQASDSNDVATHIERVAIKGFGVTRSKYFYDLTRDDQFYVVKIKWRISDKMTASDEYEVEALFTDPKECTGFSFILTGVYPLDTVTGKISVKKRAPNTGEIERISKFLEVHSKCVLDGIRKEYAA